MKHLSGYLGYFVHEKTKKKINNTAPSSPSPPSKARFLRGQLVKGSKVKLAGRLSALVFQASWRWWKSDGASEESGFPSWPNGGTYILRMDAESIQTLGTSPACTALHCLNYPEWSHYLWQRAAQLCVQQVGGTTIAAAAAAPTPDDGSGGGRNLRQHQKSFCKTKVKHWAFGLFVFLKEKFSDECLVIKCGGTFRSKAVPGKWTAIAYSIHHMIWLHRHSDPKLQDCSLESSQCPVWRLCTSFPTDSLWCSQPQFSHSDRWRVAADTQRFSYSPAKLSRHVGFYPFNCENLLFSHIISWHAVRKLFIQIHSLIFNKGR